MGRLFWKFLLVFWLAFITAGVGVGTVVWLHRPDRDEDRVRVFTAPPAVFGVQAAASTLRHGGVEALAGLLRGVPRDLRGELLAVDEAGQELLGRAYPAEALELARRLARAGAGPRAAQVVPGNDGHEYLLFIHIPDRSLPPPVPGMAGGPPRPSPWWPILAGVLASLLFSALLARYFSLPIRNLRTAFEAAARGELDQPVAPRMGRRRDELADLGREFDDMAIRLRGLLDAQRRLLHDVSHEVRSPLARLQVAVGLARQQPDKVGESLDRIEREAQRLDVLVGEALTLARLEAGGRETSRDDLDVAELLAGVVEDARFEAHALGRRVEFRPAIEGVARARGHDELLHRAFDNVIRNALRHSPDGGEVRVGLAREAGQLVVTVDDQGPGVPEAELAAIFEPFRRAGGGYGSDGFGLGLAIALRAVQAHGGRIAAANRAGGGLRVRIELPAAGDGPAG